MRPASAFHSIDGRSVGEVGVTMGCISVTAPPASVTKSNSSVSARL